MFGYDIENTLSKFRGMFLILNINHIKKINEFEYEEEVENKIT